METKQAAILVSDLVGYSRMMEEDRDQAIQTVRAMRETWFEPVILAFGGKVLKRLGDGWIVTFDEPAAAVEAAVRVQETLAGETHCKLRVGIHVGEIVEDSTDYYGAGINLATRIEVEAPPGGVMISAELASRLPESLAAKFRDAGSFRLKNIALPIALMQWRPTRQGSGASDEVPTIGVEAFAVAPSDRDTITLAEDVRDQLIQRLSRRTGVRVLDDAIGGTGGATYRLRGRVRISGARGRVSFSLVLQNSSEPAWSKSYDGDVTDAFDFCDQVVDRADTDLRVQINAFDGDRIAHLDDDELSVSELRSRAAAVLHEYTVAAWDRARQLLSRALALAPNDPMANAMHAETIIALSEARYEPLPSELAARLAEDLNRAVEASPRSDYIFWARGLFNLLVSRDAALARSDVRRTLSISPVYTHGLDLLGLIDLCDGEFSECVQNFRRSIELTDTDPILPYRFFLLSIGQLLSGNHEEALAAIDSAIQLRTSIRAYHLLRAKCLRRAGRLGEAGISETRAAELASVPSMLALRPPIQSHDPKFLSLLAPTNRPQHSSSEADDSS